MEDAKNRVDEGGTGFVISVPKALDPTSMVPTQFRLFFVTNWHVAVRDGYSVVRWDGIGEEPNTFELSPADWSHSPKYDIAIAPVPLASLKGLPITSFSISNFLTKTLKEKYKIGLGDNVFMVGLFVDHKGSNGNVPAARFGNISMDPTPIKQMTGEHADTYCIDMRSRTGYSGSPVFVYREEGYNSGGSYLGFRNRLLLGIHCGQFSESWEVSDGEVIKGPSGMTAVLPAWSISETLNLSELLWKDLIEQ